MDFSEWLPKSTEKSGSRMLKLQARSGIRRPVGLLADLAAARSALE